VPGTSVHCTGLRKQAGGEGAGGRERPGAGRRTGIAFARGSALKGRMGTRAKLGPGTIAMAAGGGAALLLYLWFLSLDFATLVGPGDAVVAQAYATLTALALLWALLLALVALDRGLGGPSWPRRAGFLLVPAAGIATLFATDYPSDRLCQLAIAALPLLAGAYALLGRLPPRQAARAQAATLLLMAALSAYPIERFV
jgi:hypothetical protein